MKSLNHCLKNQQKWCTMFMTSHILIFHPDTSRMVPSAWLSLSSSLSSRAKWPPQNYFAKLWSKNDKHMFTVIKSQISIWFNLSISFWFIAFCCCSQTDPISASWGSPHTLQGCTIWPAPASWKQHLWPALLSTVDGLSFSLFSSLYHEHTRERRTPWSLIIICFVEIIFWYHVRHT